MKFRFDAPATVFLLISIPFIVAGAIVGLFMPRAFGVQRADVAALRPLAIEQVRKTAVGQRILIEGIVSPDNAEQAENLVAYKLYRSEDNINGEAELELVERVTPPLTIQVVNGLVRIENDGYEIRSIAQTAVQGTLHYSGLGRQDRLFLVGTLAETGQIPAINAEFISAGTQADYLAEQSLFIGGWWLFAGIFVLLGLGMMGTAVFLSLREGVRQN